MLSAGLFTYQPAADLMADIITLDKDVNTWTESAIVEPWTALPNLGAAEQRRAWCLLTSDVATGIRVFDPASGAFAIAKRTSNPKAYTIAPCDRITDHGTISDAHTDFQQENGICPAAPDPLREFKRSALSVQGHTDLTLHGVFGQVEYYGGAEVLKQTVFDLAALGFLSPSSAWKWLQPGGLIDQEAEAAERRVPGYPSIHVDGVFRVAASHFYGDGDDVRKLGVLNNQVEAELMEALTTGVSVQVPDGTEQRMILATSALDARTEISAIVYISHRIDELLDNWGFLRSDRPPAFQEMLIPRAGDAPLCVYRPRPIPSPLLRGRQIIGAYAPTLFGEWDELSFEDQAKFAIAQIPLHQVDAEAAYATQTRAIVHNDALLRSLQDDRMINDFRMDAKTGKTIVQLVPNGPWHLAVTPKL